MRGRCVAWAATGGVIVAASLAAVLSLATAPRSGSTSARSGPTSVAGVLAHATTVLEDDTDGVVVQHEVVHRLRGRGPISTVTAWLDLANPHHFRVLARGSSSLPPTEIGQYVENGHAMTITIDPSRRTATVSRLTTNTPGDPYSSSPEQIQALLDAGRLTIVGYQTVDGADTVHLEGHLHGQKDALWIDPATYRLVRFTIVERGLDVVADLRWLSPSPQNLALTDVPVPPGYQVLEPTITPTGAPHH